MSDFYGVNQEAIAAARAALDQLERAWENAWSQFAKEPQHEVESAASLSPIVRRGDIVPESPPFEGVRDHQPSWQRISVKWFDTQSPMDRLMCEPCGITWPCEAIMTAAAALRQMAGAMQEQNFCSRLLRNRAHLLETGKFLGVEER